MELGFNPGIWYSERAFMDIEKLSIEGLLLVRPTVYQDERGFFLESFKESLYADLGVRFVQDNHSCSKEGVIRGMHYQSGEGQAKLVRVVEGKIFDVAFDMRRGSPTFGQWQGVYLDGQSCHQLFIPAGFAHGFCVVSEKAHVLYKVSTVFDPQTECGFHYDSVGIQWPVKEPIVSNRDRLAPGFVTV